MIVPAIASHVVTGLRLGLGVAWIVLVPAEMLGVRAGLGYAILDARDRLAYPEVMAIVLLIGCLGWSMDTPIRRIETPRLPAQPPTDGSATTGVRKQAGDGWRPGCGTARDATSRPE